MPLTGLEEFKDVFGSITVLNVVELLLAILFCYLIYRKVSKYLIERYEAGKKKDEQLKTALDQVSKYPEYRAQSLRVQKELQTEIEYFQANGEFRNGIEIGYASGGKPKAEK